MKRMIAAALMFLLLLSATACSKAPSKESTPLNAESKAATEITAQANAEVYQLLDFNAAGVGDKLHDLAKLRAEYSRLYEEKDRLYAEYGSLKNVCGNTMPSSRTSTASCPPIVGRNRTTPCSFFDIHTLFSGNLMCVRRFAVNNRTL